VPAPVLTIGELAALVDGRLNTAADNLAITGVATLADAGPGELSHLSSPGYAHLLPQTRAGVVLLREADLPNCPTAAIVVADPYWAYAVITQQFEVSLQCAAGIAATASVDPSARLAGNVRIGAGAVIGAGAQLGDAVTVHANAVVGANCILADQVEVHAGAVLSDGVKIGARSTIHPNAVIGGEGFGYAPDARGVLTRIAQLGTVVIGDDVSVGANSTIDRGALGDTRIGNGVKIDNQVQIGHNCIIGNHSVICGCCGIVGSTTIGAHCVLGGGVGIGGDGPITLCDGVTVSGMTHVSRSIDKPGTYSGGVLHSETRQWKRNALRFARLDSLLKKLSRADNELAAKLDEVSGAGGPDK